MDSLGINPRLVHLLAKIAQLSSSRLLVNGHLSPAFSIGRSVRQGDPLSMHLFVLYLHPLVSRLERECGEDLVVTYADDITVITTSAINIQLMGDVFCRFERVSGARLNRHKTKSIDVGFLDENRLDAQWVQTENTVKVLGVIFANSIRLMIKLNWDALVGKIAQQVWLHSMRSLTLHQKVTLLNTFITSKVWYLSSILPPYCVHTSKITATMGTFLWRGLPARVPMQQLARSKDKGGLKLHLPALKCKALLINRHIREIDSIPFYKSFLTQDNPNRTNPPADCPCLKMILHNFSLFPPQIQQNPSADLIHNFYVEQGETPRVERLNPAINWRRVWLNIGAKTLTSPQRSELFIFVNEKQEHRQLMHRIGRADNTGCTHCNATTETLQHKYSECTRVVAAWALLLRKLMELLNGWRRLSFEDLIRPTLNGLSKTTRSSVLKLLFKYVTFINASNNNVDIASLEFNLEIE